MLLRRIRASLSAKVFLITFVMQLVLGGVLCAILIISSPKSIDMSVNEDVDIKFEALIDRLEQVRIEDSGDIIDDFIRDTGVPVAFTTTGNVFSQITPDFVKTPSELAISSAEDRMAYRDEDTTRASSHAEARDSSFSSITTADILPPMSSTWKGRRSSRRL